MSKLKKTLIFLCSSIVLVVVVVILFISPITKYLIEKNDEQYTGRNITMGWAYVNPFTGYIHFSDLKIFEFKSDSVFFSASGVSADIALFKLFTKTYEISELTLDQPKGIIIQNKTILNFNDLIEKFTSKELPDSNQAPVHFNILNLKIIDGEFYFHEKQIPINYFIKKVNLESAGKYWDTDTIAVKFSFLPGTGTGDIKGDFTIDLKSLAYNYAVVIHKFDLNIIQQYLKDLTNYGSFSANLDANVKSSGNFNEKENITLSGLIAINDFHFGKNPKDDYLSFDKLVLAIKEVSPQNYIYNYDSISLKRPYFKYERYDDMDNLQTMFGKNGSNIEAANAKDAKFNLVIEIADQIKAISRNFFKSPYKINRLAIYDGDLKFNDYSISEKFSVALKPLNVIADSIDKSRKRVNASLTTGIKPYGNATVDLSINPLDSSDFDLKYHLQRMPATMFNPYLISQTSYPLDRGTIELSGEWKVRNGIIASNNNLLIIDPRVTKRLKNKDAKWLPLPFIMSLTRERGNVIDYEIPITGNLNDTKFHWRDAIFDVLVNVFVKPATTPYRMEVKNIETEIEKSLSFRWALRNSVIVSKQEIFIEKMADFLVDNPEASITIYPQQYAIKEKEYILFYEAKKKYFILTNNKDVHSINEEDSEKIDKMSVKDSFFVRYLNKQLNDSMLFTMQDKCARYIDSGIINAKYEQLNKERVNAFVSFFKKRGVEKSIKFTEGENIIPYNGFSFYKISYKGEFPESLLKAYGKMNELNDEKPRKKFNEERQKNRNMF